MAFVPETATAAREANRVRIYAGPRWVRPDGKTWRAIDKIVGVSRDAASGAYRVACGDDWITWTPCKQPTELLKRAIVAPVHFGDVLDAAELADAIVEYDVAFSAGVEVTAAGWRFAAIHDVPLGLFLNDLIGRFGAGRIIRPDSNRVAIDVSAAKAAGGEINLDPNVAPSHVGGLEKQSVGAVSLQASWDSAHDAAAGGDSSGTYQVRTLCDEPVGGTYRAAIDRLGLEFDTSAYGAATAAKLVLTEAGKVGSPVVAYSTMSVADVTATAAYDDILAAVIVDTHTITDVGETWESDDLITIGLFAASATYQLGFVEINDRMDTIPASEQRITWSDGYLELTVPGLPPGSLAMMGKGR